MSRAPAAGSGVAVDAHVHVYDCHDPGRFLDAAAANFLAFAPAAAHADAAGVLLLTEAAGVHFFAALRDGSTRPALGAWRAEPTDDAEALVLRRDDATLVLCAGRQVATSERLEVLALLTGEEFPDGRDLVGTMRAVRAAGGVPVIPWGFGKWLGRRGRILKEAVEAWRSGGERLFLGDNGNRLALGPEPRPFAEARAGGGLVLPGSDPLPYPSHEDRGGTYGFVLPGVLDASRPASDLRERLLSAVGPLPAFGRRVGASRFVLDQVRLQVRQRRSRRSARGSLRRAAGHGA